jgi:hypothetical protein
MRVRVKGGLGANIGMTRQRLERDRDRRRRFLPPTIR